MPGTAFDDRALRLERGRAARRAVPRGAVAEWTPSSHRAGPLPLLREDAVGRVPALVAERHRRMLAGRAAFLRGSLAVHAADLAGLPVSGLIGWGWGDAHAAGLTVAAGAGGLPVIDVDRYDDALPVPFEWDVVRLAVSLVAAGRDRGLPSAATRTLAYTAAEAYSSTTHRLAAAPTLMSWQDAVEPASLRPLLDKEKGGKSDRRGHAAPAFEAGAPSASFVPGQPGVVTVTDPAERAAAARAFDDLRESVDDGRRPLLGRYRVADVAALTRGIGGLGRVVLAVLLQGADPADTVGCELRESVGSALAPYVPPSPEPAVAAGPGARVVAARRLLGAAEDPFLGWVEGPFGRQYVWRRLPDRAWSPDLEAMGAERLRRWADRGGAALARAHARGGDAIAVSGYLGGSDRFARAVADHAERYVDVVEADLTVMAAAVADGGLVP